jgi:hypothetical protein
MGPYLTIVFNDNKLAQQLFLDDLILENGTWKWLSNGKAL